MRQLPILDIPFEVIELNAHGLRNGRTTLGDIGELRKSIEVNGLIDPLVVWLVEGDEEDDDPSYVLLAGYRRYSAIEKIREDVAGAFDPISVSIFEGSLEEAQGKNLEENIQRQDLNPADEAEAVSHLYDRVGDQTDVGKLLGKSQGWVSQRVSLYRGLIPRGLDYLRAGKINWTSARKISQLLKRDGSPDEEAQDAALDKVDEGDEPEISLPNKRRAKTYRTKAEFDELEKMLISASEEASVEPLHKATIDRCIAWYRCQIDEDSLVYDQIETESDEIDEEALVDMSGSGDFDELEDEDFDEDFDDDEEFDEDDDSDFSEDAEELEELEE